MFVVNLIIGGTQFCLTSSRPGQTGGTFLLLDIIIDCAEVEL